MSRITIRVSVAAVFALTAVALVLVMQATAAGGHVGVGFDVPSIAGFPGDFSGGTAFLTGGGAYDPASASNAEPDSAFVHSNGGFRCLQDVLQGPLQGCLQGEGVRWDSDGLLQSTGFKCTGKASEPKKTAITTRTRPSSSPISTAQATETTRPSRTSKSSSPTTTSPRTSTASKTSGSSRSGAAPRTSTSAPSLNHTEFPDHSGLSSRSFDRDGARQAPSHRSRRRYNSRRKPLGEIVSDLHGSVRASSAPVAASPRRSR